jgi:Sec-independent protein translocase protein TatA
MFGVGAPELIVLALVALVVVGLVLFMRSLAREEVRAAEAEVKRLQAVLDDVKDVAWSNRELSPDISTIIIETIRSSERSYRPELNG